MLLLAFFLGVITTITFAQEDCKICGTWSGNFKAWKERYNEDVDNKLIVRIRKWDDTYTVRVKEIDIRSGDIFYWRTCTVTSSNENSISFYIAEPMTWDEQFNVYYTYTSYYTIIYSNGVLLYNQDSYKIVDYDINKMFLKTTNWPGKKQYSNVSMYKDDEDW